MSQGSLHLGSMEQRKADEDVLKLIELQKKEKEEALRRILQLEKQLDAKQKLEMEIEVLTGKIKVMGHIAEEDDSIKDMLEKLNTELKDKTEDLDHLEYVNTLLTMKEREINNEMQESHEVLIKIQSLLQMSNDELQEARELWTKDHGPHDGRMKIGVKRMGEINREPFVAACKKKFPPDEVEVEAVTLCSFWQERLKDPAWHPFKVISSGGTLKEIVEDDEMLTSLKADWGNEVYNAVVTALKEMNEYNPSGRYVVPELWHFEEMRRATLKEAAVAVFETIMRIGARGGPEIGEGS